MPRSHHHCIFLAFLVLAIVGMSNGDIQFERDQLIEFYEGWGGSDWSEQSGWNQSTNVCGWYGIRCDPSAQHVIEVSMSMNGIVGTLPIAPLHRLPELKTLELPGNNIYGTISSEVSSMSNLEVLIFSSCQLEGELPRTLQSMTNLRRFYIDYNRINDTLDERSFPSSIVELGLGENHFHGNISEEFMSSLPNAEVILIEGNELTGRLPEFGSGWSTRLDTLHLGRNDLSGTIPDSWMNMTSISTLYLQQNRLSGFLNDSIVENWIRMKNLDMGANSFTGALPPSLGNLPELEAILLYDNGFTGTIPASWNQIPTLHSINLRDNRLSENVGELVQKNLRVSQAIDVSSNELTGTLTQLLAFVGTCGASEVDFSRNPGLSGSFPVTIALSNVQLTTPISLNYVFSLSLSGCNFAGRLPDQIFRTSFTGLRLLDLTDNNFAGPLPMNFIRNVSMLDMVMVSGNDNLRQEGQEGSLTFGESLESFGNFSCPTVRVRARDDDDEDRGRRIHMDDVDPSYFAYQGCICDPGFHGAPPDCRKETSVGKALAITLPLVAVFIALATIVAIRWRRILVHRNRERHADRLLSAYAAHQAQKAIVGSDAASPSPMKTVLNPLSVAQAVEMAHISNTAASSSPREPTRDVSNAISRMFSADSEWVIPYNKIDILRRLATGASGTVELGIWSHTEVAVKTYHTASDFDFGDFASETGVHIKLRHPNVVQLLGICTEPVSVVLEFMSRGSLYHLLLADPSALQMRNRSYHILLDIAKGMDFLHQRSIIHRDLKSLNILVGETWNAKVSDFGASRVQSQANMTMGQGTVRWMAPEAMESGAYSSKCDVYSFALIIWELLSNGRVPYEHIRFDLEIMKAVQNGERPELPPNTPAVWAQLIRNCWSSDPSSRPTFQQIISSISKLEVDLYGKRIDR